MSTPTLSKKRQKTTTTAPPPPSSSTSTDVPVHQRRVYVYESGDDSGVDIDYSDDDSDGDDDSAGNEDITNNNNNNSALWTGTLPLNVMTYIALIVGAPHSNRMSLTCVALYRALWLDYAVSSAMLVHTLTCCPIAVVLPPSPQPSGMATVFSVAHPGKRDEETAAAAGASAETSTGGRITAIAPPSLRSVYVSMKLGIKTVGWNLFGITMCAAFDWRAHDQSATTSTTTTMTTATTTTIATTTDDGALIDASPSRPTLHFTLNLPTAIRAVAWLHRCVCVNYRGNVAVCNGAHPSCPSPGAAVDCARYAKAAGIPLGGTGLMRASRLWVHPELISSAVSATVAAPPALSSSGVLAYALTLHIY